MTKFAKIVLADIANGHGWRTSIFFTGCDIRCPGCFNKSIWEPTVGRDFTEKTISDIINWSNVPWNAGLSILGGEPTADYNIDAAIQLAKRFKAAYPEKDIWLWSR